MQRNGIMAVKTLLGSLNGDEESDERKRQRKRFLSRVHSGTDEVETNDDTILSTKSSEQAESSDIFQLGVSFTTVSIREYEIVPGCNPSVSVGCPVSLGWGYTEEMHVQFQAFENIRQPQRRMQHQMRMPKTYREDKLLDFGYTKKDLKKADKDAHRIRTKRLSSMPK